MERKYLDSKKSVNIEEIEGHLRQVFNGVSPNPEYMDRLKIKLRESPDTIMERQSQSTALIVLGMGLFFGFVLVMLLQFLRRIFSPAED